MAKTLGVKRVDQGYRDRLSLEKFRKTGILTDWLSKVCINLFKKFIIKYWVNSIKNHLGLNIDKEWQTPLFLIASNCYGFT